MIFSLSERLKSRKLWAIVLLVLLYIFDPKLADQVKIPILTYIGAQGAVDAFSGLNAPSVK